MWHGGRKRREMADPAMFDSLKESQHKALAALMSESTIAKAAQASGVSERTLYRWLGDPAFSGAYRSARRAAVELAMSRLQRSAAAAADVLVELASDRTTAAPVRLGAAREVLDLALRSLEHDDLEARLAALEAAHAQLEAA